MEPVDNEQRYRYHGFDIKTHLVAYVDEHFDKSMHNYILIDEVQEIEEFERGLRNYYDESYIIIVVVTGSNSDILSGELGTILIGRYISFPDCGLSDCAVPRLSMTIFRAGKAACRRWSGRGSARRRIPGRRRSRGRGRGWRPSPRALRSGGRCIERSFRPRRRRSRPE